MQAPYPENVYNIVCKHKTCNFEYKLPTLQMDWEILYVAFLWITPHKPTWRSLQNAKSCPQCLDVLYLYMPMLEHLYIQWKTRGWFYLSGEWCERSCGFVKLIWLSSTQRKSLLFQPGWSPQRQLYRFVTDARTSGEAFKHLTHIIRFYQSLYSWYIFTEGNWPSLPNQADRQGR